MKFRIRKMQAILIAAAVSLSSLSAMPAVVMAADAASQEQTAVEPGAAVESDEIIEGESSLDGMAEDNHSDEGISLPEVPYNEEGAADADDQEAVAEEKPSAVQDSDIVTEDQAAAAEDTETVTEDQAAAAEDTETVTEDQAAAAEDTETATEDQAAAAEDTETVTEDQAAAAEDTETVIEDQAAATKDSETLTEGADADDTETVKEAVMNAVDETTEEVIVEHEDNDTLFEGYAESVFETAAAGSDMKKSRKAPGEGLTGNDLIIFNALRSAAAEIAAGNRDSAVIEISLEALNIDPSKQYFAEDLGVDYIYREDDGGEGEWNPGLDEAVNSMLSYDKDTVLSRLWADCPYEMYWQQGTISSTAGLPYKPYASWSEEGGWTSYVNLTSDSITFSMTVESKYRAAGGNEYSVDTSKTGAASNAASYAQSIVSDADESNPTDYDRLVYYKDRICQDVVYNEEARQNSSTLEDRGAWALIYVFDQDPETNVVCEGYSEAFQYLCELTTFKSSAVYTFCPTGVMGGGTGAGNHKWNIIHMDDGKYYMADVTNSDEGSVGSDGRLFLKGITGSVQDGYVLSWEERQETVETDEGTVTYTYPAGLVNYTYDDETLGLFSEEELTLSAQDYVPGAGPDVDSIAQIDAISLFLTDKIGLRVHTVLDRDFVTDDDYITFVCAGRTQTQAVSEADTDDAGRAVFELELTARQMKDEVTFYMTAGGTQGASRQYSVRQYADQLLADNSVTAEEKNLVRAMLNYGSYTQIYVGYNIENLAAEGIYTDGTDPVQWLENPDLSSYNYSYTINDREDGLTIDSISLLLGTDISIRFYYTPGQEGRAYTFSLEGGFEKPVSTGYDEQKGAFYASVDHLTPRELSTMYTCNFYSENASEEEPAASVTLGALSYCKGILEDENSSEEIKNLCKAIYYYKEAVGNYLQ